MLFCGPFISGYWHEPHTKKLQKRKKTLKKVNFFGTPSRRRFWNDDLTVDITQMKRKFAYSEINIILILLSVGTQKTEYDMTRAIIISSYLDRELSLPEKTIFHNFRLQKKINDKSFEERKCFKLKYHHNSKSDYKHVFIWCVRERERKMNSSK